VTKSEHSYVRPWYIKHPVTEEEIRVTCNRIDYHDKTRLPYFMDFQRYIVGKPNLIRLPVIPVKDLWVWSFNDTYPAQMEVDCSYLSPNMAVKVGDVERMLPYGMYLHK
jgi:hypothetical protein